MPQTGTPRPGMGASRLDAANQLILEPRHTKTGRHHAHSHQRHRTSSVAESGSVSGGIRFNIPLGVFTRWRVLAAGCEKSFHGACRRAEIDDFRIHDLRHTCAAWLVSAGVALPEMRDLLGHTDITTTERYAHLAPENVRATVAVSESASRSGHVDAARKAKQRHQGRCWNWWSRRGSNPRPPHCERGALPAELLPHDEIKEGILQSSTAIG